jgi:predicted outer membrane protein
MSPEKQFVEKAAAGNNGEIKLAELAARKCQDPQIKDFANRMTTDHGKANNDLKPIGSDCRQTAGHSSEVLSGSIDRRLLR